MTCVDLAARFGERYRIGWEADGATRSQWPREEWAWLMELRCRYGKVHPLGGELLAAVTSRRGIAPKLRALPCVLATKGDAETVVTFRVSDAEQILVVLQPYRRRRVSDAERDRLRRIGFGRVRHTESESGGLGSTIGNESEAGHAGPATGAKAS